MRPMDDQPKVSRTRLSCTECSRRKVKCDKQVPCSQCRRRNLAQHCTRVPDKHDASVSNTIQFLLQRVSDLENRGEARATSASVRSSSPSTSVSGSVLDHAEVVHNEAARITSLPVSEELTQIAQTSEVEPATVLEFLAWGRNKDHQFFNAPENDTGPARSGIGQSSQPLMTDYSAEALRIPQISFLSTLLPDQSLVRTLVAYHSRSLLWYHGSYDSLSLSRDLDIFYDRCRGSLTHEGINLQWVALLFAVLSGSFTCASTKTLSKWGVDLRERNQLSRQWYRATVTCLNLADYLENHTIYAVSAICTLTISAHILGCSNTQSVLLSSATRLAQSLGLHCLAEEVPVSIDATFTEKSRFRKRETGRRIWGQLCTQDWFSIPFADSYSINMAFFATTKPQNCNEVDLVCQAASTPTITSYCNYLYDIAQLIPQLHDATTRARTLFTKYEQVLEYDGRMRRLATAHMPTFLQPVEVSEIWPVYVPWGRRSLAICAAHKIIMIHRKFLGLSFTNSTFSFTRKTCLAACKTILKEVAATAPDDGPVLWIDQAFTVAAGIILILDCFYRSSAEREYDEHKELALQAINYLQGFEELENKIAIRGIKLLTFLLDELESASEGSSIKRRRSNQSAPKRTKAFNLTDFLKKMSNEESLPRQEIEADTMDDGAANHVAWDAFDAMMPPQTGFGGDHLFDHFFSFTA